MGDVRSFGAMKIIAITVCCLLILLFSLNAGAFEYFPKQGCHGTLTTVVKKTGINTENAVLEGLTTSSDVLEECERMNDKKQDIIQCAESGLAGLHHQIRAISNANCISGPMHGFFSYDPDKGKKEINFPLSETTEDADYSSCASEVKPLIEQMKMLCPLTVKKWIPIDYSVR